MSNDDIIAKTPLETIAESVRRQFREQSMRDLSATKKKISIPEVSLPPLPVDDRMQSKRRSKSDVDKKAVDALVGEMNVKPPESSEEDNESLLEGEGLIYSEMPDGTPGEDPLSPEEAALQLALAVRKGHEKGKPDIDWYLVKLLYVYGGWTYERISNECNVSFSLVRLNGRKGRWPESRESYRSEQAQKIQERLALEEDRLRDWQIIKRRQAGIDGLNWFVKAISNLKDDASPESIAKLGGLMDRMLSSVTGLAPVEGAPGGVSVQVQNNNFSGASYASNSPQAKLAAVWEKKVGETENDHTRRLALTIRELYIECERAGLYEDLKMDPEGQRQMKLRNRLGLAAAETSSEIIVR
jgi:hypothetical protein